MSPTELVLSRLEGVRRHGQQWDAVCPAHDDHAPSLGIREGGGGRALLNCRAGCKTEAVVAKLGLTMRDLMPPRKHQPHDKPQSTTVYDYRDATGELLFQVVRYKPKGFRQRRPDGRGGWIWDLQGVPRVLYQSADLHDANRRGNVVYVVEGEKDADALAQWGLCATCNPGGAGNWRAEHSEQLRGAKVVIIPDNDAPGRQHAEGVANALEGLASSVSVLTLEGLPQKGDVSDWISNGGTKEELIRLTKECAHRTKSAERSEEDLMITIPPNLVRNGDPLLEIVVNDRYMHEITADAERALERANGHNPFLFRRGSALVQLVKGPPATIEPIGAVRLKGLLDRNAAFVQKDLQGNVKPKRPPQDVVTDLLAQPKLSLPELEDLRSAPLFLPDGRLLAGHGYDHDSGIYIDAVGLEAAHDRMPRERALDLLLRGLLIDFQFADEASRAHALALIVLPFARMLINGATPLHLIEAPARGTGKGLLADVTALVATGKPAPVMPLLRTDDELDKRITPMLREAAAFILLDNVTELRSPVLAAALTSTVWRGRVLGESQVVQLPNRATWVATGNNVDLSDELMRRVVHIRLDAGVERPEARGGFRHPNLPAWVFANRVLLVSASLSLVRAWIAAGAPKGKGTLGRFESWVQVMGGILDVAGVRGFLEGREVLHQEADRESREWVAFCAAWWERFGDLAVTAGQLLTIAEERELLVHIWGERSPLGGKQRLGHALARNRGRVYGSYVIQPTGTDANSHSNTYRLTPRSGDGVKTEKTPETRETSHLDAARCVSKRPGPLNCAAHEDGSTQAQPGFPPGVLTEALTPNPAVLGGCSAPDTGVSGVSGGFSTISVTASGEEGEMKV